VLRRFGYDVGEISADLSQAAREEVLDKLRRNKLKFLVATDVAARVSTFMSCLMSFNISRPKIMRPMCIAQVAPVGPVRLGLPFRLCWNEEIELEQIAKKFSIALEERQVPTDEELEALISQRAVFLLKPVAQGGQYPEGAHAALHGIVTEVAANDEARAVLAMLMDDFYQKTFHAPLEQPSDA
jgi:ATP-dependent RNA helicase DeaD